MTRTYGGLNVESATRLGKLGAYSAPPNAALAVLGTGLFAFLQGRIAKILRNLYPVVGAEESGLQSHSNIFFALLRSRSGAGSRPGGALSGSRRAPGKNQSV